MYFGERKLPKLKSCVQNKARPKASIVEGYLAKECMTLWSRHLHNSGMKFNRLDRNDEGDVGPQKKISIFCHTGRPLGVGKVCNLDTSDGERAHLYILKNYKGVSPFFR